MQHSHASVDRPTAGGPSASGEGSRPCQSESDVEELDNPKLLRAVARKYGIESTKSLVTAYNATTDKDERGVLLRWLRQYNRRNQDCSRPEAVLEYAELAKIVPRVDQEERLLRNFVYALRGRIHEGEFLDERIAKALFSSLTWVESSVYDDPAQLVVLATDLVSSLSCRPRLTKKNFSQYEATFLAIHQTFFLLHTIGRGSLIEGEKKDLRRAVAKKKEEMKYSITHYPVHFSFALIQQAVERLEIENAPSHLKKTKEYAATGLYGGMHVFHFLRKLVCGDIDPAAIEDAYRKSQEAIASAGVSERQWYDLLEILTAARLCALKSDSKIELFIKSYEVAIEGQIKTRQKEEQKALRYGIIQEIKILASQGSSDDVRNEATTKLIDLATKRAVQEKWMDDLDVLIAFFNAVHEIHVMGEYKPRTEEALREMVRFCQDHAEETVGSWLGGRNLEDKLQMKRQEETNKEREKVFISVGRDVGYLPSSTIHGNVEDLKKTYLHDNFAKVPSLFEPQTGKHVKDMEHHVVKYDEIIEEKRTEGREEFRSRTQGEEMDVDGSPSQEKDHPKEYCEQKKKVTTTVSIEDFFKPRSLKARASKSEIRKVLLYGNPGTGKTCISKAIAHKWALGEMLQEFKAVYVVPIRRLNLAKAKGVRGEALEEVVAQMCFKQKGSNAEFEELKSQVNDDLDVSSTLLMFDGLDEADDDARELLSESEKGRCKVLILTRPYNLRDMQRRVDCQFECLGFSDRQLENFINKELEAEKASRLVEVLQATPAMWEIAHIPLTAHILCCLSKGRGINIQEKERANMYKIYTDMISFVWKRFEEKPEARVANKAAIFQNLEKIAFESLRSGQILIEQQIVENYASSTYASRHFRESGLLLLVLEGQEYQFPHLTFQEYFAGRHIARSLKQKGSDEETRALEFVQGGKYNEKHALTLSFAMHAFGIGRSKNALKEMLSIVDEQPVELLGIQHFFLRMQVFEAIMEETDDLDALAKDERAIELTKGARRLLEGTLDNVLIREIVVEKFQRCFCVLEEFPMILDNAVEGTKTLLASSRFTTQKEKDRVVDVLKLAEHSSKHSNDIRSFLQLHNNVEEWRRSCDSMANLKYIATKIPQLTSDVLPTFQKGFSDEDTGVRRSAMLAMCSIVKALPRYIGDLLPVLRKGCDDEDFFVCSKAIEAIAEIVEAEPQHAGDLLPVLHKRFVDKSGSVRSEAGKALCKIVRAAPHLAGEVLLVLKKRCIEEEDSDVRSEAIKAIHKIVRAEPHLSSDLLPTFQRGCEDENSRVRWNAMEAIGSIVKAVPDFLDELLSTLQKGCEDEDSEVRMFAMEAIGSIATSKSHMSEKSEKLLPTLQKDCKDKDTQVCESAMEAVGDIDKADSHTADELLPTFQKSCEDEDSDSRSSAMETIDSIATSKSHMSEKSEKSEKLLPTLQKDCKDKDTQVCESAMEAVGDIDKADSHTADELLPTFQKSCEDEDSDSRSSAMGTIDSIAKSKSRISEELLSTLQKGCVDHHFDVRRKAMEAVADMDEAKRYISDELLPTLQKDCEDENAYVRERAMETVVNMVEANLDIADELLSLLQKGCDDEDFDVRYNAMFAISQMVEADPYISDELLPTLQKGCDDEHNYVRKCAMSAIKHIVEADPDIADELLPTLQKGCDDDDPYVRKCAMKAMGYIVEAAPHFADDLLPALQRGCDDEDTYLRRSAMLTICRIVEAVPDFLDELLPTLQKGFCDKHSDVRSRAMEAFDSIAKSRPHIAGELLPILQEGCVDEHPDVRWRAREILNGIDVDQIMHSTIPLTSAYRWGLLLILTRNIFTLDYPSKSKKVSLLSHKISSERIGVFDREDINNFLMYLRKELDERFSGLSDYLKTKD